MDVITTHTNADFDCLGAMVAAGRLYPGALMVFSGSQEKSMRAFFIKSAGYAFNFTRLKDLDLNRITRLILVDCQHASRIGPFAAIVDRPDLEIHIYDHHPDVEGRIGATGGVIRSCGSSTTLLVSLLMAQAVSVTATEATLMMLGIYEDTGSLTFPTTTVEDFQAAAWLLQHGAQLNTVADFVTRELTAEQVALLNDLLHSLRKVNINGIEVNIASASVEYYVSDIASLAHMIRDMESLDVLILAVGMANRVYLVGRSRLTDVNVGEILREFGGGGHHSASSATVRNLTLIQVLDRLDEILARKINPRRDAAAIMSSPVKSLTAETRISDAREVLTRYNVNAMPVMNGDEMVGVISRRIVEKALYHGLGELPVTEYMHTEFMRANPGTTIMDIKEYLVGQNRRFLPVFDGDKLVGVVTRADLLRQMHAGEDATGPERERTEIKRDVFGKVKKILSKKIVQLLRDLGARGDELGLEVYVVGGFVRDLLLGEQNLDIDVTVEGDGIKFAESFAARCGGRVKSHDKFGTAVILLPDGLKIDVASTRLEYYDSPGVLPTVERSSLKMDLYRRDFTVNTLAISISGGEFGHLVDYFGGQHDLKDKVIRVLHNLSFVEDPTRVFRAIRFEQRLGFHIAAHTEKLILNAVKMNFLDKLGGRRLLSELVLILKEREPLPAVERMDQFGLLRFLHPLIRLTPEIRTLFGETRQTLSWYDLLYLNRPWERWMTYFLAITAPLDDESFQEVCRRLEMNRHMREKFAAGRIRGEQVLMEIGKRISRGRKLLPSEYFDLLKDIPDELLLHLMARSPLEEFKRNISLYFTQYSTVRINITGRDLEKMGVRKGPLYRKILDLTLAARLNGELLGREDELRFAEQLAVANMQQ